MFEHWVAGVGAYATLRLMNAAEQNFEFLNEQPPFSKREIDRLGQYYAGRRAEPPDRMEEILWWYGRLAASSEVAIGRFIESRRSGQPGEDGLRSSSRVKSAGTIIPKVRDRNIQLSRVQDFAGTRFTWNCLHTELRAVAEALSDRLQSMGCHVEVKDYIKAPQQGYRAIHLWLKTPAGRIEVQLRTILQSAWANAFERAGDITGRRIRYEADYHPDDPWLNDVVNQLIQLSDFIYEQEMKEEKGLVETEELLLRISDQPKVLPLYPETHLARAQLFMHLSGTEESNSARAQRFLDVLRGLDRLAASLDSYGKSKSEGGEMR